MEVEVAENAHLCIRKSDACRYGELNTNVLLAAGNAELQAIVRPKQVEALGRRRRVCGPIGGGEGWGHGGKKRNAAKPDWGPQKT